MRLFISCYY